MLDLVATTLTLQLPKRAFLELGLPIYEALSERFPRSEMVLLESLGRTSDARSTLVAADPLLTIEVRGVCVRLTGTNVVLEAIAPHLHCFACEYANQARHYTLPSRRELWNFLRQLERAFCVSGQQGEVPLALFGYWGYETIIYIEPVLGQRDDAQQGPDIALGLYRTLVSLQEDVATVTHYGVVEEDAVSAASIAALCEEAAVCPHEHQDVVCTAFELRYETTREAYLGKCRQALTHIGLGDVYQIQIGQKLTIQSGMSPLQLYKRLRERNPSPYMYLFTAGSRTVVGASPELFVRTEGQRIVMRPIAGTVGKAGGLSGEQAKAILHGSEKEVAEHLMLVDLCRNDICRTCLPHSLNVTELMAIEEYSHVYHMVSNVSGEVDRERDKYDVFMLAFPAGTMTGTPKIRAIELIDSIEDSAREQYAGAVGLIGIGNNYLNTALCIRSAVFHDGVYTLRASAGIVADSVPESEYRETLHKLGSVFNAITDQELA
ncbi:anthranilate synthase component I family protein [Xanthomonas translucens]|uniref:anthranilate synthase component I family protein n=1 Tax=Xanthomonas campestris pv. translucens TaxID=343 RepID=UPI0019D67BA8|nr:anthranilate synthase component I family protein [Xanthomonas translucens]QSQ29111.1 anthranilate synthase component I family protein [Xanthomonas translucens pv. translucens]